MMPHSSQSGLRSQHFIGIQWTLPAGGAPWQRHDRIAIGTASRGYPPLWATGGLVQRKLLIS